MVLLLGLNLIDTRILHQVKLIDRVVYRRDVIKFFLAVAWCLNLRVLALEGQRETR